MNKEKNDLLKRLKDDRMYRTFSNLKVRSEQIETEDGKVTEEMVVEGQAVTFENPTVLFKCGET